MILDAFKLSLRSKRLVPLNIALFVMAAILLLIGIPLHRPWWHYMLNGITMAFNVYAATFSIVSAKRQVVLLARGMR